METIIGRFDSWLSEFLTGRRLPYPSTASIEPISNVCQLKCPLCPTGLGRLNYDRSIMSLETFKFVLGKMPFVRTIDLYKSGEPFLNPDIFAMVKYAAAQQIEVIISTNFSFSRPDGFFEDIVNSGLWKLVISLDGASQESYSQYRIGGNYELVMSNIIKLIEAKKRLRSRTPEIVWQFLVNRFNEHEIPAAEKIADNLKILLHIMPMDLDDELPDFQPEGTIQERKAYWLPADKKYICDRYQGEHRYPLFPGICTQLFNRVIITADGKVFPCCWAWDRKSVVGDLLTESFEDIWYNQKYISSRSRFLKKDFHSKVQTVCFECKGFGTTPSLRDKLRLLVAICRENYGHRRRRLIRVLTRISGRGRNV
jgi:radical SAM protein with 4Fe4S-binding SPASM domain